MLQRFVHRVHEKNEAKSTSNRNFPQVIVEDSRNFHIRRNFRNRSPVVPIAPGPTAAPPMEAVAVVVVAVVGSTQPRPRRPERDPCPEEVPEWGSLRGVEVLLELGCWTWPSWRRPRQRNRRRRRRVSSVMKRRRWEERGFDARRTFAGSSRFLRRDLREIRDDATGKRWKYESTNSENQLQKWSICIRRGAIKNSITNGVAMDSLWEFKWRHRGDFWFLISNQSYGAQKLYTVGPRYNVIGYNGPSI